MPEQTFTADWYAVLGVPRDADLPAIKRAYRKLAKQFHPDTSSEPDAEERFKLIQAAFEVLSDPDRRAYYDHEWMHADPLSRMDEQMLRDWLTEHDTCLRCQKPDYRPDDEFPGFCADCKSDEDAPAVEGWAATSGANLLDAIRSFLVKHHTLREDAYYDVLALYCLHTHVYEAKRYTPYMLALSPVKGSGKTTLLELLAMVCARSWIEVDPAAIATATNIDITRPTLMVDEIDGVWSGSGRDKMQLRTIINAGNHKNGSIMRSRKGQPTRINVYCPKVLAGLENYTIPETTRDRCISIILHKQTKEEGKKRSRITDDSEQEGIFLRQWAAFWAKANFEAVQRYSMKKPPEHLHGRQWDKWEPLFAIGMLAGGNWTQTVVNTSMALIPDEDEDPKITLLRDLRAVFAESKKQWMESDAVVAALNGMEGSPWAFWANRGMTTHMLAKMLRAFGVKPELNNSKLARGRRGYSKLGFERLWRDYLEG